MSTSAISLKNSKQNRELKRAANMIALKTFIIRIIFVVVVLGTIGYLAKAFGMNPQMLLATVAIQPVIYFTCKYFGIFY